MFDLPSGTILIPLAPNGVSCLPDEVPTLWVLAPTQSRAQAGLAINARFAVDIGRSEVTSQAQENHDLGDQLATELDVALMDLYEASTNWVTFRGALHLNSDVTFETFWRGMWQLLAERQEAMPDNFAGDLVRRVFWRSGGARTLVNSRAVVPSGLSGHHDVLTSLSKLSFVVTGILAQSSMLEAQVSLDDLPPGVLVHEQVWTLLETLLDGSTDDLRHVPRLMLGDAVRRRFGLDPQVRHDDEPRAVPPPEQLTADKEEVAALRSYLDIFRFESATGDFVLAKELLIARSDPEDQSEEALRAAFAPIECLLHPERTEKVERLFRICRRDLLRSVELVSGWAAAAVSDAQKTAVLTYVLKGNQGTGLAEHAAFRDIPWLQSLLDLALFRRLPENDRFTLAGRLGLATQYRWRILTQGGLQESQSEVKRSVDPKGDLESLYERWEAYREPLLRAFEQKRYPSFMHGGEGLRDPQSDREQWMGLFLIGSYMTLGRIETGTRGFLEKAHHKGWMQTFSAETLDADGWFAILDAFVENEDAQYRQWINRFLATYQISRYLGDYISVFQGANSATEALTLQELLDVRESHLYTGTGLNMPSVRSALGIGQHFVLRELVRRGVIANRHLDAQCYVPTKKVRERLYALGCNIPTEDWDMHTSRTISKFLESHLGVDKARFHGDFDLPFVLLG